MKMVNVEFWIHEEDDHVLAWCPSLDVMTQGENTANALQNLEEAVNLFVESCMRRGVWKQILEEEGLEEVDVNNGTHPRGNYLPVVFQEQTGQVCHA